MSAVQYFYFRKTLPDVRINFRDPIDEPNVTEGIDLIFVSRLSKGAQLRGDLVLNYDSFPEMGDQICESYFNMLLD